MYGSNIGSLQVEAVDADNGDSEIVWVETGNKGAFWQNGTANLSSFAGKNIELNFISTTGVGGSDRADIGLDEILVEVGAACEAPEVTINVDSDISCSGANDGAITAVVAGGTSPYSYEWSNGATTASISNLFSGTYSVTVTDAQSCNSNAAITILDPPAVDLDFIVTGESTAGAADGSIDLTVSGGIAPYTYQWSNGATSQDIFNLSEGTYSVTVTDSNNCETTGSVDVPVGSVGTCNDEGENLPIAQTFEAGFGEFENGGDFDWMRNSGSTSSRRTGPSGAFEGNFYAYAEANGNLGDQAILLSPCLDLTGENATLSFSYHMFGSTMGSLMVEVAENGGFPGDLVFSRSGNQGDQWFTESIDLSAYTDRIIRVRFIATMGNGSAARSDIAIDGIQITSSGGTADSGDVEEEGEESDENDGGGLFGGSFGGSFGGWFGFSNTIDEEKLALTTLAPVPANDQINLTVYSPSQQQGSVKVMNHTGQLVNSRNTSFSRGLSELSLDISNLPSGLYIMIIEGNGERSVKKFEVAE